MQKGRVIGFKKQGGRKETKEEGARKAQGENIYPGTHRLLIIELSFTSFYVKMMMMSSI